MLQINQINLKETETQPHFTLFQIKLTSLLQNLITGSQLSLSASAVLSTYKEHRNIHDQIIRILHPDWSESVD